MKPLLLSLAIILSITSCKKFIEKKQEQAALNVATKGRWVVGNYTKGSQNLTSSFSGYQFQFQTNETVEAIRNGAVEKTGSWKVDMSARTITSKFENASDTLLLINGSWIITNSSLTTVDASQTVNGEQRLLHLDKI